MQRIGAIQLKKVEIISKERKNLDYTVGSQEEAEMVKKVGFPVNHAKMMKKELNLVEEKMHLKELNKDADQLVLLVKHIKEGEVNNGRMVYCVKSALWNTKR